MAEFMSGNERSLLWASSVGRLYLVYYRAAKIPIGAAVPHIDISSATDINYYQYLCDICLSKLFTAPIQLGGTGREVQTNEYLLLLVRVKIWPLYRRGRNLRQSQTWIFGAHDVAYKVGYITQPMSRIWARQRYCQLFKEW